MNFRDLIKPGEGARLALQRELETRRDRWTRTGYHYRGAGDFLLQHGKFYTGRPTPPQYEQFRGAPNACFYNAYHAMLADPSLAYCEGVYSTGSGHFTPHAWCIAPDGDVVELTYETWQPGMWDRHTHVAIPPPEHWGYWGVVINGQYVEAHGETLGLPMMDRPAADQEHAADSPHLDFSDAPDWPLLRVPFDPSRTALP